MKKVLIAFAAVLMLVGCKNDPQMSSRIIDLEILPNQWEYTNFDNNNHFFATFKMPEFTRDVYDNATVNVYREYNTGTNKATQTALPYVRHKEYAYDGVTAMPQSIVDVDVKKENWQYSGKDNNNYFFAEIEMPEINWDEYNNSNITVYREYDSGTDKATQTVLPQVRHKEYCYDEVNNLWGFFTETVDAEFTNGKLTIFYTASDFDYELNEAFVPDAMHFRIVISGNTPQTLWGNYTETVDYEYTQGSMTFYYTVSDFEYELDEKFVPEGMHFRVVILYRNY